MTHAPGYPMKCDTCKAVCHTPKAWKHHRCAREVDAHEAQEMTASEAVADFNKRYPVGTLMNLMDSNGFTDAAMGPVRTSARAFVNMVGEGMVHTSHHAHFPVAIERLTPAQQ